MTADTILDVDEKEVEELRKREVSLEEALILVKADVPICAVCTHKDNFAILRDCTLEEISTWPTRGSCLLFYALQPQEDVYGKGN